MKDSVKMNDADYFAIKAVDVASVTLLKKLDCPAKALIPFRPTPAMLLGTLVHCAVLEPEEFDDRYVVAPVINKRTNAGKAEWKEFVEANAAKAVLTMEEKDTAFYIARCVMAHSVARDLLTGGEAERVYSWENEKFGVACKGKADYVNGNIVVDLKTAQDASPGGFSRSCANFGYHMQDAHYTEGSQCDQFIFVVVETTYPFVVEVYELDEDAKLIGRDKTDQALHRFQELNMFDLWGVNYSGEDKVTKLSLPGWAN
ncbi:MAG: PD-(D/E)XK nuclease-like domain-containing protein [Desulfobacterales bacterium]